MYSDYFSLDPSIIYLNHAAVAPWPKVTVEAVSRFARENGETGALHYPEWMKRESALRASLARLINAPTVDDIALLKSTSEGLSVVAHGVDWQPGDNVVSIAQEFPSNRIVWQSLEAYGIEARLLDLQHEQDPEQALMSLCDSKTRLLAVSSVQYASGRRMQLERLGDFCRRNGILFVVDAIQSLGALPFDVTEVQADVVVADGHKWMLGPEGLALFYCRADLRERLRLRQYGWHMVEAVGDFEASSWQPANSARRFECGSPNMLGIHALLASLELLQAIGIERVFSRIEVNTEAIIEQIKKRNFELLSPGARELRAGIITFRIPDCDTHSLQQGLMRRQVVCAERGGGIRFSPHFYNTKDQIEHAFEIMHQVRSQPPH
ncbi:MAG: aminotransferase class V-fold PLP-dependent enzyme [Candidatus Thiodiazotropha sp.]